MVFVVIPPVDTDVGSPLDEKLMDTIRVDLNDLDTRTTTNTTDITTLASATGGGGFGNMQLVNAPGTWTSPATATSSQIVYSGSTGGGGGGQNLAGQALGGAGGASTPAIFFSITLPGTAGGANNAPGVPTPIASFNGIHSTPTFTTSHNGGLVGASPITTNNGIGGFAHEDIRTITIASSTVYPITIGQAGAGGGGSGGYGSWSPGGGGGVGGLVPHSYLSYNGNNGTAVATPYILGAPGSSPTGYPGGGPGGGAGGGPAVGQPSVYSGGAGGGTGVHASLLIYY